MSYDDQTKDQLQEELRDRDLPVSGTKDELIERLEEDDRDGSANDSDDDGASAGGGSTRSGSSTASRPKPLQLARLAARQLEQISGRRVDGTSGLERTEEGWRVALELVETARIPPATDVLGTYEVIVDEDGDLLRYERLRRYIRGQAGEDSA